MAFFRTDPNVPDGEKARIEFSLQQIAECVGFDRFKLPVLSMDSIHTALESNPTPENIVGLVGQHLGCDVGGIQLKLAPKSLEKCGSGG